MSPSGRSTPDWAEIGDCLSILKLGIGGISTDQAIRDPKADRAL